MLQQTSLLAEHVTAADWDKATALRVREPLRLLFLTSKEKKVLNNLKMSVAISWAFESLFCETLTCGLLSTEALF
jgi:hypothetical protein